MTVRGDQRTPEKPSGTGTSGPKKGSLVTVNAKGGKKGGGGPHIHVHVDKVVNTIGRYRAPKE